MFFSADHLVLDNICVLLPEEGDLTCFQHSIIVFNCWGKAEASWALPGTYFHVLYWLSFKTSLSLLVHVHSFVSASHPQKRFLQGTPQSSPHPSPPPIGNIMLGLRPVPHSTIFSEALL